MFLVSHCGDSSRSGSPLLVRGKRVWTWCCRDLEACRTLSPNDARTRRLGPTVTLCVLRPLRLPIAYTLAVCIFRYECQMVPSYWHLCTYLFPLVKTLPTGSYKNTRSHTLRMCPKTLGPPLEVEYDHMMHLLTKRDQWSAYVRKVVP